MSDWNPTAEPIGSYVDLSDLTPHPRNYKGHPADQIERLRFLLRAFGQPRPISVWRGTILAGHGVYAAAREEGWTTIWCAIAPDAWTEERATAWMVADNETARGAEINDAALAELIEQAQAAGMALEAMGVTDADVQQMLADLVRSAETPGDAAPPMPTVEPTDDLTRKWAPQHGDLWLLPSRASQAPHRLFCGPASEAHIHCDAAVYDPPFDWATSQQETALAWVRWRKAIVLGLAPCFPLVLRNDFLHWWVWDSGMARFGGKGYKPMSGCMMVLVFGEKRMWNEQAALAALDRAAIDHYDWPIQVVKIQDSLHHRDLHTHQKPMALWDYLISLYSEPGMTIGDPFAGSAPLLVLCERQGRTWHGAEVSIENCAVILERYEREIGLSPQRTTVDSVLQSKRRDVAGYSADYHTRREDTVAGLS